MSGKTIEIQAPTPGRVVLFNVADADASGNPDYVVPAVVHQVVDGDLVLLWAVYRGGDPIRALGGGLPAARYKEKRPGVPALDCWCYPARSEGQIQIPFREIDPDDGHARGGQASDFDLEETFTP